MPDILAVIQARGGSKGIPRKNIAPVAGRPLLAYTVTAALESELVDLVVVSTDDGEIAEVARRYGARVPFTRPSELSGDEVLSVDSLRWAVLETERRLDRVFEYIVELPCVAPLRGAADIDAALEKLISTGADSVISVTDTGEKHPIRLKRIVYDRIVDFTDEYPEPAGGSRRQDLSPPAYIRNGAIYSMTRDCLIDGHSRHGANSRPWIMPSERSINIDEPFDLKLAELMIREGLCPNRPRPASSEPAAIRCEREAAPRLLVTANLSFLPEVQDEISRWAEAVYLPGASRERVIEHLVEVDAWMCSPCPEYSIGSDLLKTANRLAVIGTPSTGTNHIDLEACASLGIEVRSLRETALVWRIYASSEFTFGLVLALTRKIPLAFDRARQGWWRDAEDELRGIELHGKTLGLIGYGRIGSNVARYAHAYGMEVAAFDPYVDVEDARVDQMTSSAEVRERADILLVCVHLDRSTRGMVDRTWFETMKDGAYFINTSRGEIVNQSAMLEALETGKIAAAAVDVISNESVTEKATHPLIRYARRYSNLIVTPHIAGLTRESELKAARQTLVSIEERLDVRQKV